MVVSAHRAGAPGRVTCFVLTVSDTRTAETDTSGRAIADMLTAVGHHVLPRRIVRDEPREVVQVIRAQIGRGETQVVIATGGTGLGRRDTTCDALAPLFDRRIEGFGELFRALSYQEIGAAAMLSRATAGVIGGCAIFLLPGSEAAVRLAMEKLILPELGHVVAELLK
jgi:molybdenum cofactor biosynthesis protein B